MWVRELQKKRTVSSKGRSTNKRKTVVKGAGTAAPEVKKDHSLRNYELMGIVLAAVGIICLCGIVGLNVGFVGLKAAKFLQYFFGIGAMPAAAVFVGVGGYYIMKHTKLHWNTRMVGGILFYTCGLGMYHHWVVKEGAEILPESLVDGGGLLGGILTLILHKVVGTDGTPVLLGAGLLGSALVVTTWSLAKGILTTKEKAEQGAQVAKKATVVAYDKTLEVGTKAKEQVQNVGEKLQKLKGREFLSRYEEESAFLNQEAAEKQKDDSLPGSRVAEKSGKLAQMPNKIVQEPKATGNNLVDANPVAANFFGAEFASDVEPEAQVPSLASQLGISEEELHPEMEQAGASSLEMNAAVDSAPTDNSRHDAIKFFDDIVELDLSAPVDQEKTEGFLSDMVDLETGEVIEPELDTTIDDDLDWDSLQLEQPEDDVEAEAYDYGLDDMDISYSQDSVDITENVPDDEGEIEEAAVQELSKPAVSASVANTVSNTASAAVGNLSKASTEVQPPPPPYILPSLHLLSKKVKVMSETLNQEIAANARILGETLANFKVKASILNACHGPAVTRYEVKPAPGVKVSKITGLADDIALNMAASAVRIEQIPGKAAIGIEVPNQELESVQLREVLENPAFAAAKSRLTVGLGKDISGQAIFADLAKMPHLLVAGATGSGKSVCINTLITSILFKAKPTEVKFILIDPKMVELSVYNDIPHLMVPVVTDAKKAASVLNWAVQEMEKRYGLIAQAGVRNMDGYNKQFEEEPEKKLPSIVIIIDELADLMMVAPHDVEDAICRIAQKARAAGIYLVLATQRPSVNVITGVIKANIPSRISFAVTSQIDSRTILDASGAEKLLGKGDMLFKPQEANKATRIQGAFVSDKEVELLVEYIKSQGHKAEANQEIIDFTNKAAEAENEPEEDKPAKTKMDSLLREAVELVMSSNNASASSFQRRYHIGYSRAGRLLDTMEQLGIVGPPQGSKPRDILVTEAQAFEIMDNYESQ